MESSRDGTRLAKDISLNFFFLVLSYSEKQSRALALGLGNPGCGVAQRCVAEGSYFLKNFRNHNIFYKIDKV